MSNLTVKQEKFIAEYIKNGGNATQAYRDAYDCKNWTEKSINEEASKMLVHPKISPRIAEYKAQLKEKFSYTAEQSFKQLNELLDIALGKGVESGRINLQAALKAEELKGKLLGLYTEKVENTHKGINIERIKFIE